MRPNPTRCGLLCAGLAFVLAAAGCPFLENRYLCFEYGGLASEITDDHGHDLYVPPEDFDNAEVGGEHTYSIAGDAGHDHDVTFSGEQLIIVSGQNSATVTSTETDGHTHDVTLDCAGS